MASRINQAILRSEELRAERTLAELNIGANLKQKGFIPKARPARMVNPNPNSSSFIGAGFGGGVAGLTLGTSSTPKTLRSPNGTPNFTTTSGTLSAQVRKNQMKRKAFLKAQSLAREDEELSKQQMKQIKDRQARKLREAEASETKMNWTEPDGSKTILKFDEDGNLIGREVTKPTDEFLSTEELIKAREIARRKEEADDGRLQRDRKGNALSRKQYNEAWTTDPRTQKKIMKQVVGLR